MSGGHALALAAFLLLSGCTLTGIQTGSEGPNGKDLAALVGDHDYAAALELLRQLPPEDPQRLSPLADRTTLRAAAKAWRELILVEAERLAEDGRWSEGTTLLAAADAKLPDALKLTEERVEYKERQDAATRQRVLEFALRRANHLASEQSALQRALAADQESPELAAAANRQAADREQVLAVLVPAAETALEHRRWQNAADLLSAALALEPVPSDPLKQKLKTARDQLANVEVRKRRRQAATQRQAVDEALLRASIAKTSGNYSRATALLARARTLTEGAPELASEVASEQRALDNAIRDVVESRLAEGDRLYAGGEIEAALRQWQRAWRLQPESSEIKERIERAERFIERYRALKREEAQPLPEPE